MIYNQLKNKEKKISVIGLGYVGLPLALEFAKYFSVIGFDINEKRIEMMRNKIDPSCELESSAFDNKDIVFTNDIEVLKQAHFHIVAVPTPVNKSNVPDLKPLIGASNTVGKALKKGDYVIFESTVYPGATEEDCLPILEELSGLKLGDDFKLGYSPERINPGDKERTVEKILKIVSGSDAEALDEIANVYGHIIKAGVYKASTIKVAEAAKVIENTQRDINIAFMNELSRIFEIMDINTKEVLDAAGTKWNFIKLQPGLVGGHCIGVDPYYLTHKAQQLGYLPEVILSGRRINDGMPAHIAKKTVQMLIRNNKNINAARVLVLGITFKENVSDIRNSKVADLIHELKDYSLKVDVYDPHADAHEVEEEYGIHTVNAPEGKYDALILAVAHNEFMQKNISYFTTLMNENPVFVDIKSLLLRQFDEKVDYWAL